MFDNPGTKIKDFAKVLFAIEILGGIIGGIAAWIATDSFAGIFAFIGIIIASTVSAYITSLFLVAFGELVENSTYIVNKMNNSTADNIVSIPEQPDEPPVKENVHENTNVTIPEYLKGVGEMPGEEKLYQYALKHIKIGKDMNIKSAIKDLELIVGYKDSEELLRKCYQMLENTK